jgi:hypothetical protein
MQKIPLAAAAAGMKLAKSVNNKRGMVLCSMGTELTEAIIDRLADMKVELITVEGHPIDTADAGKSLNQKIDELHARFSHVEKDPLMRKIKDIFLECLKKRGESCE